MISKMNSRWSTFYEMDALKTAPFLVNGQCVQRVMDGSIAKGRPSDATASSEFLGVAFGIYKGRPANYPKVEVVTFGDAAGGLSSALLKRPIANAADVQVYLGSNYTGTLLTLSTDGSPSATEYEVSSDKRSIVTAAANAAAKGFVIYNYVPTLSDMRFAIEDGGDSYPGNDAQKVFNKITVIRDGIVATDQFDKSVNWSNVKEGQIKGGANGIFTTNGNGCVCTGVRVKAVPAEDMPFLVLAIGDAI